MENYDILATTEYFYKPCTELYLPSKHTIPVFVNISENMDTTKAERTPDSSPNRTEVTLL